MLSELGSLALMTFADLEAAVAGSASARRRCAGAGAGVVV